MDMDLNVNIEDKNIRENEKNVQSNAKSPAPDKPLEISLTPETTNFFRNAGVNPNPLERDLKESQKLAQFAVNSFFDRDLIGQKEPACNGIILRLDEKSLNDAILETPYEIAVSLKEKDVLLTRQDYEELKHCVEFKYKQELMIQHQLADSVTEGLKNVFSGEKIDEDCLNDIIEFTKNAIANSSFPSQDKDAILPRHKTEDEAFAKFQFSQIVEYGIKSFLPENEISKYIDNISSISASGIYAEQLVPYDSPSKSFQEDLVASGYDESQFELLKNSFDDIYNFCTRKERLKAK